MEILISNADNRPIYEQIYAQIKDNIISGALKEGELLPSIRTLAKDLRISVITTKRAYDELEKGGYVHTVPAKGCYVAEKNTELLREEYLMQIENHMQEIARMAPPCGLSEEDAVDMLRLIYKGES
ncbi:MAG: GntR family transcriptional regulator [Clostridiales bacterium]|nr:GntR family transcriptional regulator [Clostridiales bacterium]